MTKGEFVLEKRSEVHCCYEGECIQWYGEVEWHYKLKKMKTTTLIDVEKGVMIGMLKVRMRGVYIAIELKTRPLTIYTVLQNYRL